MAKASTNTLTKLAARRREVMEEMAALGKEKAEIDAKLLAADLDEVYTGNGVELSFTSVRNLDGPTITKKFPADKYPDYYKLTLDTPEFKRHFSAVDLEQFQVVSHRINVKEL